MRKIAIIGSGTSGMFVAHKLLQNGYDVTVYSDRTADDWLYRSAPTGTAYIFERNIKLEQAIGLDHWFNKNTHSGEGIHLDFQRTAGDDRLVVLGGLKGDRGAAIDVRMRVARWMNDFEEAGGKLVIGNVRPEELERIGRESDLVLLAAGKGEIGKLIQRDPVRSVYDRPQRKLVMGIVEGVDCPVSRERTDGMNTVKFDFFADAGEWFWVPYQHKDAGPTWCWLMEAKPGGYLDKFDDVKTAEEASERMKAVIREYAPYEYDQISGMTPVRDDKYSWLKGAFPPSVREAFAELASGTLMMPVGDTAITFDPIGGQGGNCAQRNSDWTAQAIIDHGDQPFDAAWANQVRDGVLGGPRQGRLHLQQHPARAAHGRRPEDPRLRLRQQGLRHQRVHRQHLHAEELLPDVRGHAGRERAHRPVRGPFGRLIATASRYEKGGRVPPFSFARRLEFPARAAQASRKLDAAGVTMLESCSATRRFCGALLLGVLPGFGPAVHAAFSQDQLVGTIGVIDPPGTLDRPGGFISTLSGLGTGGNPDPGFDPASAFHAGADVDEESFVAGGPAGAASSWPAAPGPAPTSEAAGTGSARLGRVSFAGRAQQTYDFATPEAVINVGHGGWVDTITISHPTLNGTQAIWLFDVDVAVAFDVEGWNGAGTLEVEAYVDRLRLPVDTPGFHDGDANRPVATDVQHAEWRLRSDRTTSQQLRDSVVDTVTFAAEITLGTPFDLGIFTLGAAGASTNQGRPDLGSIGEFDGGVTWGGSVGLNTIGGAAIGGHQIASLSGVDWVQAVPLPAMAWPAAACLLVLLAPRRQR